MTIPSSAMVLASRGALRGDIIHAPIKVPAAAPITREVRMDGVSEE
jgi:hypothetical protein